MAKTIKELAEIVANLEQIIIGREEQLKSLSEKVEKLSTKKGPSSLRDMTEDDARKVKFGELKDLSHKKAAEKLGLSYGQIYSARGEYTFKHVEEEK